MRKVQEYLGRFHAGELRLQWAGVLVRGLAVVLAGCGQGKSSTATGPTQSVTAFGATSGITTLITSPTPGSTITTASVTLQGTFGPSDGATPPQNLNCGTTPSASGTVSSGSLGSFTFGACSGSVWPWSVVWNGYSNGTQTVTVTFSQPHGPTTHSGSATANYNINVPSASSSCSPVGWIPPVTLNPTVKRPSTLPIKFCPSSDLGATHDGTLAGPSGCTVCGTITFRRTDDGIYMYQFRSRGEPAGTYTVDSGGAPGVSGSQTFTVIP